MGLSRINQPEISMTINIKGFATAADQKVFHA
jgi:hypothetical protein